MKQESTAGRNLSSYIKLQLFSPLNMSATQIVLKDLLQ